MFKDTVGTWSQRTSFDHGTRPQQIRRIRRQTSDVPLEIHSRVSVVNQLQSARRISNQSIYEPCNQPRRVSVVSQIQPARRISRQSTFEDPDIYPRVSVVSQVQPLARRISRSHPKLHGRVNVGNQLTVVEEVPAVRKPRSSIFVPPHYDDKKDVVYKSLIRELETIKERVDRVLRDFNVAEEFQNEELENNDLEESHEIVQRLMDKYSQLPSITEEDLSDELSSQEDPEEVAAFDELSVSRDKVRDPCYNKMFDKFTEEAIKSVRLSSELENTKKDSDKLRQENELLQKQTELEKGRAEESTKKLLEAEKKLLSLNREIQYLTFLSKKAKTEKDGTPSSAPKVFYSQTEKPPNFMESFAHMDDKKMAEMSKLSVEEQILRLEKLLEKIDFIEKQPDKGIRTHKAEKLQSPTKKAASEGKIFTASPKKPAKSSKQSRRKKPLPFQKPSARKITPPPPRTPLQCNISTPTISFTNISPFKDRDNQRSQSRAGRRSYQLKVPNWIIRMAQMVEQNVESARRGDEDQRRGTLQMMSRESLQYEEPHRPSKTQDTRHSVTPYPGRPSCSSVVIPRSNRRKLIREESINELDQAELLEPTEEQQKDLTTESFENTNKHDPSDSIQDASCAVQQEQGGYKEDSKRTDRESFQHLEREKRRNQIAYVFDGRGGDTTFSKQTSREVPVTSTVQNTRSTAGGARYLQVAGHRPPSRPQQYPVAESKGNFGRESSTAEQYRMYRNWVSYSITGNPGPNLSTFSDKKGGRKRQHFSKRPLGHFPKTSTDSMKVPSTMLDHSLKVTGLSYSLRNFARRVGLPIARDYDYEFSRIPAEDLYTALLGQERHMHSALNGKHKQGKRQAV